MSIDSVDRQSGQFRKLKDLIYEFEAAQTLDYCSGESFWIMQDQVFWRNSQLKSLFKN